jgi:hypothetical protein
MTDKNTHRTVIRRSTRCWLAPCDSRVDAVCRREGDLTVIWGYDAADPYAVTLRTPRAPRSRQHVVWAFARDLLGEGLFGHHGPVGDVRIWPDGDELCVELTSPTGHIALWLKTGPTVQFLVASYDLVPDGTESERIDWDRERRVLGIDADPTGWGAAA